MVTKSTEAYDAKNLLWPQILYPRYSSVRPNMTLALTKLWHQRIHSTILDVLQGGTSDKLEEMRKNFYHSGSLTTNLGFASNTFSSEDCRDILIVKRSSFSIGSKKSSSTPE